MDPVTGDSFGVAFPPNFDKIRPYIKETQKKIMIRMKALTEKAFKKMSDEEFQKALDKFKSGLQISSVIVMVEVRNWGNTKQVLADLISSRDGMPFKKDNLRRVTRNADGSVDVEP